MILVYLLWDKRDLVGIFSSKETAEAARRKYFEHHRLAPYPKTGIPWNDLSISTKEIDK